MADEPPMSGEAIKRAVFPVGAPPNAAPDHTLGLRNADARQLSRTDVDDRFPENWKSMLTVWNWPNAPLVGPWLNGRYRGKRMAASCCNSPLAAFQRHTKPEALYPELRARAAHLETFGY